MIQRRKIIIFVLMASSVALITLWQCLTLDDRYSWFGDGGLYLQHGRNIFRGEPYRFHVLQQIFPPGYPFLVALWGGLFSFEISSLKLIGAISIGFIGLGSYFLSRAYLRTEAAALIAIIVSAAPVMTAHRYITASDLPFAVLAIWSLVCWQTAYQRSVSHRRWLTWFLVGLMLSAAAMATRIAGFPFYLAAGGTLFLIGRNRPVMRRQQIAAWLSALGVYAAGSLLLAPFNKLYLQFLDWELSASIEISGGFWPFVKDHLVGEVRNFYESFLIGARSPTNQSLYDNTIFTVGGVILFGLFIVAVIHYWRRWQIKPADIFFLIYMGQLVFTPWTGGTRYYIILFPYVCILIAHLMVTFHANRIKHRQVALYSLLGAVLIWSGTVSYAIRNDVRAAYDPITTNAALEWLKARTQPEDIVCAFNANNMNFFLDRKICGVSRRAQQAILQDRGGPWLNKVPAQYLLLPLNPSYSWVHAKFAEKILNDPTLEIVFQNADYVIFQARAAAP